MDKKTISILVLLALVTFAGVGWIRVGMRSTNGTLPTGNENISPENLRKFFPGYENYFNREIFSSQVRGSSMEPTFGDGDKVLWVQVDPAELKVGDIIIYNHPTKPGEGPIAHRIIKIMKYNRFETKGDNRSESDAETAISAYYVGANDLMGLVIGVIYS